jgi:PAS domain S-box-containing protein
MNGRSVAGESAVYRVLVVGMGHAIPPLPGYEVVTIGGDLDMLFLLGQDNDFDLIMGNLSVPDILIHLRSAHPTLPVIVLARTPSVEAAFQAGQHGVAAYLPATVDTETLREKIEAAIQQGARRSQTPIVGIRPVSRVAIEDEDARFGHVRELTIDRHRRIATFRQRRLELTRSQFDILANLVENKGRVVLFEELAHMLQGNYPHHAEARRALSAHISDLRKALKKQGCDGYILNSWGRGFLIESDVEELLRQSETRLRLVLEQMPCLTWSTDTNLNITWTGGKELTVGMGIQAEDLIGMSLQNLLGNEEADSPTLEAHQRGLQGEAVLYERRRGLDRYYQCYVEPLRDATGTIIGTIGLAMNIMERKQAEEKLRESEERYRIMSGMMSDYVYSARVMPGDEYQTEVEWVAGALTRITGYTEEEVRSGMKWDKLVHPDDWEIVEERRKRLLRGEQDVSEFRMMGKHGQRYWVRTYTYPVWDAQEKRVVGLLAAVKDITEQKEAQEALRSSEERFRKVSEVMSDYVYCFRIESDQERRLEWMTGAYERITGYSIEEAMNNVGWMNIVHPDDGPIVQRRIERLWTGQNDTSEWRIIRRDGVIRWLRLYGQPVVEDGGGVRVYGGAEDITEQKAAQDALRESEANIRRIVEEAPAPMLLFQGTKVVYTNPAIESLSGYSREEWLTMDFYEVIHPDMRDAAIERALRRQRGERVRSRYEVKIIHKNGELRWIDYMATVIQYEGKPAVLAIVADITQRKAMEATLRQTEADLRGIIAGSPAPMFIYQDMMMRFVNPAAQVHLGYTQEELLGMNFWDVIHPDMRDLIRERGMKRQEGEPVPQRYEVKLLTKQGETRWVDYIGTLIQYEGKPAVLGIVFDITEQKRAQAALYERDERLLNILQHMPIMVDAFDEEGRIVVWNRECELVTGYSAEEITNHPNPMQLLYPNADYLTPRLAEWETQGDNFRNWEWELIAKDGCVKTIAWSNISAQFPLSGWKTWGIGVDVTTRKAAERALYQTEEHLRMVISSAPVVLWTINKDGIYTMSEGKALEDIGYEPGEVVGQSIFEVNAHLPDVLDNVRRALSGESFTAPVEYNRGVKFETHYIPVCDDEGRVTDVLAVSILKNGRNGHIW